MQFFLDTANIEEIQAATQLGVISGVTTNPSLIAREKRDIRAVIAEITGIVAGPVSAEVVSTTSAEMIAEAKELAAIAGNVIVKVPMCAEGLKAASALAREQIRTNMTLIFSANQALLAARAGASYVSPFVGRLDDIGFDGISLIGEIAEIFAIHAIPAKIIAASIRHPLHVTQAAQAGAHIATIPYKVLLAMMKHPLTDAGIRRFLADWHQAVQG